MILDRKGVRKKGIFLCGDPTWYWIGTLGAVSCYITIALVEGPWALLIFNICIHCYRAQQPWGTTSGVSPWHIPWQGAVVGGPIEREICENTEWCTCTWTSDIARLATTTLKGRLWRSGVMPKLTWELSFIRPLCPDASHRGPPSSVLFFCLGSL